MSDDLSQLLQEWPYEPGQLAVRVIEGDDGRQKIQLRVDLGVMQMETDGRPDGLRPHGYESLLEYEEARLDQLALEGGDPERFALSADTCRQLREEAAQYYHRYVAMFVLEGFDEVVRDTSRNLRLLDFFADHAAEEVDRNAVEQFRAYILMMRTRALATQALRDGETKAARLLIDEGVESIRVHFEEMGAPPEAFEQAKEVQLLRGMHESLTPKLPKSPMAELTDRLRKAVQDENYELAAILRDELKAMDQQPRQG
ncbi:MAG: UvrB/UvrC motif-containing protein [Phycisphaeraceae bacterium]|nr:UvrB/UvrC motif-containing protein [Phycisphaeraceae bacterium]MCB9848012.1 UvrB/UvrC motif-containing protein [Phycisphaeraceae bacterium]